MWRFWSKLPPRGQMAIYDRSWYGRVLVERVEGFCSESAWQRAYGEINRFEKMLVDDGTVLLKLWLHVTKDEQLVRIQIPRCRSLQTLENWRRGLAQSQTLERTHRCR
jgi:polyphosphate kinase 2 (PPK2 family)